jgi:hypothetical protein
MMRWFLGCLILYSFKTWASGAWYQTPQQIPKEKGAKFIPEFVILKVGIFSKQGKLTLIPSANESGLKRHCATGVPTIAWITHRLSPNEQLNEEAGKILGGEISKTLEPTCFSAIELDIEPLTQAEPWLEPFLKGVKLSLKPSFQLRLAIPVLSPKPVPGHFWTLQDGVKALKWVDGLDVMAYDSGVKTSEEYKELFKNTFFFVMELNKQSPEKKMLLGLPTYPDKTKLHSIDKENLESILSTLKSFTPFQLKPYCKGDIRFSFYAGWTLSPKDVKTYQQIKDWKNETCKKSS